MLKSHHFSITCNMEFLAASNRLNYLFPCNAWGLITNRMEELPQASMRRLKIKCKQWSTSLAFPFEISESVTENSSENQSYWYARIPELKMLDQRKQHILISDLFQGYNPTHAANLFIKKLNLQKLSPKAWGYLINFGGVGNTYSLPLLSPPSPQEIEDALSFFYQSGYRLNDMQNVSSARDRMTDTETWHREFEEAHGLTPFIGKLFQFFISGNTLGGIRKMLNDLEANPYSIQVCTDERSIYVSELDQKIRMKPLSFAIYCLYLNNEVGFTNKNRIDYKSQFIQLYREFNTQENDEIVLQIINGCFNLNDDKPWRDAVSNANEQIKLAFEGSLVHKKYIIAGGNGKIKRISLNRELVYWM